jgi:hypothetical protein
MLVRRHRRRAHVPVSTQRAPTHLTPIPLPTSPIRMRAPCHTCGSRLGLATRKAHNAVISCAQCGRYQYNAPRPDQVRWWGQTT